MHAAAPSDRVEVDGCVYAATPSGILAAIAVKHENRSVVIVEPSRWVGGMLGAGLKPLQDCPNYNATGGMTRKLLPTLGASAPPLVDANRRSLDPKAIRDRRTFPVARMPRSVALGNGHPLIIDSY